jgi:hypothetical protein
MCARVSIEFSSDMLRTPASKEFDMKILRALALGGRLLPVGRYQQTLSAGGRLALASLARHSNNHPDDDITQAK